MFTAILHEWYVLLKISEDIAAADEQYRWSSLPLITQTDTYWLSSTQPSSSFETIKMGAKPVKLLDQTIFGGEAMSLKLSNIKMRSRPLKLSTCKVATVLSCMTSFSKPPTNMTFYVNKLHENSKSRLLQTSATFCLASNPPHRQGSPCKIECCVSFCTLDC